MDNLRCAEHLFDSPSTSMATMNANANANNNNRQNVHNHQQQTNLMNTSSTGNIPTISTQSRRRSVKITNESRLHQEQGRLILGQLPVNRKRSAPTDRLNTAQWPSVLALSDKTIHQDNRCVDSMFTAQNRTSVNHNYFLSVQTHITAKHRQQAVEWLLDVCREEHCEPDVFPLSVSYIDRFLALQNIFRDNLQTLASACLFIASKVKAAQPLQAKRIAYYTNGGVPARAILSWETLVLSKLNWDLSTATALDFLDQVAARYSTLHCLGDACRKAVHRIQLEEKFALLVPSMQAAICLLYSAVRTGSDDIIMSAEHALFHLLRCDPKLLYGWLQSVERIVDGINCGHNGGSILMDAGDISPLFLEAPPSSGDYMSPATSPYPSTAKCLQNCITMTSNYTTPDHQSHNDSGFNSGFSSPAAFFEMKMQFAPAPQLQQAPMPLHQQTQSQQQLQQQQNQQCLSRRYQIRRLNNPANNNNHNNNNNNLLNVAPLNILTNNNNHNISNNNVNNIFATYEQFDNGLITRFHPTEEEFLRDF